MTIKIDRHEDVSHHQELEGWTHCHEFYFSEPISSWPATLEDPGDDNQEDFDVLAIEALEQHLGFRFDEDDWYMLDWRDDQTLWVRYNMPYPTRRLPL